MKQYLQERSEPSSILIKARQIAGHCLEEQFKFRYNKNINEHKNYRWIKAEWTYPSFEHFTFAYKNKIFPVFVDIIEDGRSSMKEDDISFLVNASREYNFTPCIFKIKIISYQNNKYEYHSSNNINMDYYYPLSNGWNLYEPYTDDDIIPEVIGNDDPVKLSELEMMNFAIQIVKEDIIKKGWKVFSFCDLPIVNPQIWIEDNFGKKCWVIVRAIEKEEDNDPKKWINIIKDTSMLENFDGYFAGVKLLPINGGKILLRGEGALIDYKGIKSAYLR